MQSKKEKTGENQTHPDENSILYSNPQGKSPEVEITGSSDGAISIRVTIYPDLGHSLTDAAQWFAEAELKANVGRVVRDIRRLCVWKDAKYFFKDSDSKMERMMASVAANYPRGLTLDDITNELELTRKAARAYMTSANNATSRYLYLDETHVKTTEYGIPWIWARISPSKKAEDEDKDLEIQKEVD